MTAGEDAAETFASFVSSTLGGRAFAAGYLFPLIFLRKGGVADIDAFLKEMYFAGTHEDVVNDVRNGVPGRASPEGLGTRARGIKTKGKVYLVDDDELILAMLSRALRQEGYDVEADATGQEVPRRLKSFFPEVALLDIKLPGKSGLEIFREIRKSGIPCQVVMLTSDDTAETAIKAMKLGAADYLTKPFDLEEVKIVIGRVIENGRLRREGQCLRFANPDLYQADFLGESAAAREIKDKVGKLAEAGVSTLLITGESSTGKEVLARYLHQLVHGEEGCRSAPFLPINCTALPESLRENELFGYEKGAFADAKMDKRGVFELASRGSNLLGEIGEMKPGLQAKLLRVLEERAIRRVGGGREIPVDVIVMATTNRDLPAAMEAGEFRTDFFTA